ncbi:MAG: cobyrinate a,c-diamide synthase [Desulfuromonadales bacterium]
MRPLIVAAPASGSGKSSVVLGLLGALRRRGLVVAPFKVGPDFIDPGHHADVAGRVSYNLDGWMCGRDGVLQAFAAGCRGAGLAVVEGVMGLFDGTAGATDAGSTAEIARWLDGKLVLVVDARAQARSAAAVVHGFTGFAPDLDFAGVLYNRVGSANHANLLREAHASVPGLPPLLGCLPRRETIALPERHLGLVTAGDAAATVTYAQLADWVEEHVDLDRLLNAVSPHPAFGHTLPKERVFSPCLPGEGAGGKCELVRIGVARDAAFCFSYPENLELLERAGAELVFFSPLADRLPPNLAGLYLPGGYPELHRKHLTNNRELLGNLRAAADGGLPIYAECGGLLLLAASLDNMEFAGVFPAAAQMLPRRQALGYREVTMTAATPLGPAGTVARGHEFHYSELAMPVEVVRAYRLTDRSGQTCGEEGYLRGNVLGSYVHLHFASNPRLAENFVAACRRGNS